ncbi:MAG: hypothetical protein JWM71_597 [Solirubrobacteraceae bacterium]|nr:hypothetical protein [Solirubrobacteraceae bacterium]
MPGLGTRAGTAVALATAAAWVGPTAGHAAVIRVHGTVSRGTLAIAYPSGRVQTPAQRRGVRFRRVTSVELPFRVVDERGSGAGWAITMAATSVRVHGRRLKGAAVFVAGMTVACRRCTLPVNRVSYPLRLPGHHVAIRAFSARRRTGMGAMDLRAQVLVTAPGGTGARDTTVRLVFSQTAGP